MPRVLLAVTLTLALTLLDQSLVPAGHAAEPETCSAGMSAVACENTKPGSPREEWDIWGGAGDPSIQGFSTDISVNAGQKIDFKIDTDAQAYTINIYRTGWYQGLGARKVGRVTPSAALPQHQPECLSDLATELYDCGSWAVSASWDVPADAVSGVYIALLERPDTGGASHITFVVRNDGNRADVIFQTSDPTWQAYNTYGGSDFYQGGANTRAYKISYNRPVVTRGRNNGADFFFSNEYPLIRFLEKNGYDVTYFSGVDTDRRGGDLLNHKVFLSVGHDEYWSAAQRENIERARNAGVNLQFLSGNEGYWHTRYEPSSIDSTNYRTLVSYKETWSNGKTDPSDEWTGTWRDPRFASPENGAGLPENNLTGTMYTSNFTDLPVTVNSEEGKYRLWRNTDLSALAPGTAAQLAPHTIGYESDEDIDNGFRPEGLVHLSTTTGPVPEYLQDFGNVTLPGTTTHHLTMYRAPSGALVFSAGSIQWSWGLDQRHDGDGAAPDGRMQQAQVNLLADMGAQPGTLDPALVQSAASTDTTAPVVAITSPKTGLAVAHGTSVTVAGTARDAAGEVAGVEVSVDGGVSWHPAQGTNSWSYSYVQLGVGAVTLKVRASDDSGNFAGSETSINVNVNGPYSVFGNETPRQIDSGDTSPVELGLRFTPTMGGYISGVRFYKSSTNTGTHTGTLWDTNGNALATVTFADETAEGWQSAAFVAPVQVDAGKTYVVSYSAPNGHYSASSYFWASYGRAAPPLKVAGGFGAQPAGVYNTDGGFPTSSYQNGNYYVDPIFETDAEALLVASDQWPLDGSSSVATSGSVGAVLSGNVDASSVRISLVDTAGAAVAGTTNFAADTGTATFTPASRLNESMKYTATISAKGTGGGSVSVGQTWSFTTVPAPAAVGDCPCSLYDDSTAPGVLDAADGTPVTLGVRFAADTAGTVAGIRFYKGPGNTGTHTGSLFSADGTLLGSVVFSGESTAGWQTATFDHPVQVSADTEYYAAYKSTTGTYSATVGGFSPGFARGPLRVSYDSGAYSYSSDFPNARTSTSYLVDVLFNPDPAPMALVEQAPLPGTQDVAPDAAISVTVSTPVIDGYRFDVSHQGTAISGSTVLSNDRTKITFQPAALLPGNSQIDVSVSNVTSAGGSRLADQNWTFRTRDPNSYTMFGDQTPVTPSATEDTTPIELGTAFTPSLPGIVTAIRFYKGSGNTGSHTGSVWNSAGERLASVQFSNETATGWQTAVLDQPLGLAAGQSYIVSYFAPQGGYAYTPRFFTTDWVRGPLTAAGPNNGRFLSGGGMPINSWNATNYFVDVVYKVDAAG